MKRMASALEIVSNKVLVVEDEAMIRLSAAALVEDMGFTVLEAESADEAIALLEANPDIRVVFTDIQMAGSMDGLQLVAYAHDRWPPLKFIIVSGDCTPGAADLPAGAYFFAKPYDLGAVGRTLHDIIAVS